MKPTDLASHEDPEIRFLANVITHRQRNPQRKLRGLCRLIELGYTVRTAQFDIGRLVVNDKLMPWSNLETFGTETFGIVE